MGGKVDFRSVYDIFKCIQVSNELLPKTKVVDLEMLNNFGIQEFFIWGQENGEKLSLQNEVLEIRVIY